jgi:hypothetical protein
MGGAAATQIDKFRAEIKSRVGDKANSMGHCCDVLTDETLRVWPLKAMLDIAEGIDSPTAGAETIAAVRVITAKTRENLEARWQLSTTKNETLRLLSAAVVIEIANVWFNSADGRTRILKTRAAIRGD